MSQKDKGNGDLVRTVTELRDQTTKLTTELDRNEWTGFRNKPSEQSTVLIRSNIIRDIDQNKPLKTDIKCLVGAKISDMTRKVVQLKNDKYRSNVLVCGNNDCSDTKDATVLENSFKDVISAAKLKAASVTVASICQTQCSIDNVNTPVRGICDAI